MVKAIAVVYKYTAADNVPSNTADILSTHSTHSADLSLMEIIYCIALRFYIICVPLSIGESSTTALVKDCLMLFCLEELKAQHLTVWKRRFEDSGERVKYCFNVEHSVTF